MSPRTLLVIPAYRESARLPVFLASLLPSLRNAEGGVDVLVVDDGSGPDETRALAALLDQLRPAFPNLLPPLLLPVNGGKGSAIQTGWAQVRSHGILAFIDADGSISGAEFLRGLAAMQGEHREADALFGSRVKMLGRHITRHFHRHLTGRIYATLIGLLLKVPVYDSQCGLKLLRAPAWSRIKQDLAETGFAFDVDLLLALLKHGCRTVEMPIDWHDVEGSKVRLMRDSLRMFLAVLRLRARYGVPSE